MDRVKLVGDLAWVLQDPWTLGAYLSGRGAGQFGFWMNRLQFPAVP